ncbi:hypothetical protein GOP47_0011432 [Adiantum capillus-veneris]|uniref:Cytochrome P450 n=1 Tax=Adiantum capillus-veneris TaxID=13818 RepID=A0A9D4ZFE0_ADICA|nr:hypothetical protein GOP47_0011432 [Adiantum capillus-veneris]
MVLMIIMASATKISLQLLDWTPSRMRTVEAEQLITVAAAAVLAGIVMYMANRRIRSKRSGGDLPPGTMGCLPIIGETLEYARPNCSLMPGAFLNHRIQRYGVLFKSHLFGEAIIISTDAKVNQFILQKEGTLFKSSYPRSILNIIGKQNTTEIHGQTHKAVRNAVLNVVGTRIRSDKTFSFISAQILKKMETWGGRIIHLQEEATRLSFNLVINQLLSLSTTEHAAEVDYLFQNFEILVDGLLRVPINLPGMPYRRSMQARSNVIKMIERIISEKRSKPDREISDVLDALLAAEGSTVTREVSIDVMVGVIFAAYETTSSIFTFATKFITDNPRVLEALKEEHSSILNQTACATKVALTWDSYKLMTFTEKVVKETLRLANAGDVVFREAIEDVKVNGYTIPKGWKVMPCFIPTHMDAYKYLDPLSFNPWRWDQEHLGNADFMPFGGGIRQCAGKELAKLEVALFIHHLVTRCRWEQVEEDEVIRSRGAKFKKGLPLYFHECNVSRMGDIDL